QTGSNEPFSVNHFGQAWFVEQGTVDLFVVPVADGKPAGPRSHLMRANAGQIILGIPPDDPTSGVSFVAVGGPQSEVYRLPLTELNFSEHSECALVEQGIIAVYNALSGGLAPTECEVVDAGFEIAAETGAVIRPADKVLWIRHGAGCSLLAGLPELRIEADEVHLPLSASAWLVTEQSTRLSC